MNPTQFLQEPAAIIQRIVLAVFLYFVITKLIKGTLIKTIFHK